MRSRPWYVRKFFHGHFRGCVKVPAGFDAADRLVAELTRRHANAGWSYEIANTDAAPPPRFSEQGAGI
jgi:hypothetical protein